MFDGLRRELADVNELVSCSGFYRDVSFFLHLFTDQERKLRDLLDDAKREFCRRGVLSRYTPQDYPFVRNIIAGRISTYNGRFKEKFEQVLETISRTYETICRAG